MQVSLQTERNLHLLHLIEQISYEQLLSASIARFHFITTDKKPDSICALQLRAGPWRADSRLQYTVTDVITSTSLFMGSTNWPVHNSSQASINHHPQPFQWAAGTGKSLKVTVS